MTKNQAASIGITFLTIGLGVGAIALFGGGGLGELKSEVKEETPEDPEEIKDKPIEPVEKGVTLSSSVSASVSVSTPAPASSPVQVGKKVSRSRNKLPAQKKLAKKYVKLKSAKEIEEGDTGKKLGNMQENYVSIDGNASGRGDDVSAAGEGENLPFEIKSNPTGFMKVGGEKETYGEGDQEYGKGQGHLLGTLKSSKSGIVIMSTIKDDNGVLKVEASAYALLKEDGKDNGIAKEGESKESTEINQDNKKNLIIQPGEKLEGAPKEGGFGFELDKVCSAEKQRPCEGEPTNKEAKMYMGELVADPTATEKLDTQGTSNFDDWSGASDDGLFVTHGESFYGETTGGKFEPKVEAFAKAEDLEGIEEEN